MKRIGLKGLLVTGAMATMLCGCVEPVETISDAQEAKEAMNGASNIYMEGDYDDVNQETDILADGVNAGRMEESGFLDTKWTVTAGDETWFYVKFVTDEPINEDPEGYTCSTTYGYYDANDNCLGYAQQRATLGDDSMGYYYYFMDAEQNLKDYLMEETGKYFTDLDGNVIAEAYSDNEAIGNGCSIQINMAEGCDTQIDFMAKLIMYLEQYDEMKSWYSE